VMYHVCLVAALPFVASAPSTSPAGRDEGIYNVLGTAGLALKGIICKVVSSHPHQDQACDQKRFEPNVEVGFVTTLCQG